MKANQRRAMFASMSQKRDVIKHLKTDIKEAKSGIARDKKTIKELKVPEPTIKDIENRYQLKREREKALMKQYPTMSVYALKSMMHDKYGYSRDE